MRRLPLRLPVLLLLVAAAIVTGLGAWRLRQPRAVLLISHGGTYTGQFTSTSSRVPCLRIVTTEPVVVENCLLTGPGDLIVAEEGAHLTVRQCTGRGVLPEEPDQARGRFLTATSARQLTIEHNLLDHTTGILVYRWSGTGGLGQTLRVRYNQVRNIDGRYRNGGAAATPSFLGLNQVRSVAGIDISFNEIINEPDQSSVGDVVNLYNSSGTPASPIRFHANYLQGAYPYPATRPDFTGSGFTTDGDGSSALTTTAYVEAYENQIVSTCNAAMNIAAGHHIRLHHNRMVTSGQLSTAQTLRATYAATSNFNAYHQPATVFFGNRIDHNVLGYVKAGYQVPFPDRHDLSTGNCSACAQNQHLPNPITLATERQEWALWQQRLQQQGVHPGPQPITPKTTAASRTLR